MSKYNLGLVEIINPQLHGSYFNYDDWLNTHYLTFESDVDVSDFYSGQLKSDMDYLNNEIKENIVNMFQNTSIMHPNIRNYKKIVSKLNYVSLEIIETIEINPENSLDSTTVAIKKTFWLRIFQRKWKEYYRKKLSFMKSLKNLYYREIHGKYPPFNVF